MRKYAKVHNYAFSAVLSCAFVPYKKRSQILASEDLVLRPIRFGSYGDKIWFFRPEDLAAFLPLTNSYDYQIHIRTRFQPCLCSNIAIPMCAYLCTFCIFIHKRRWHSVSSKLLLSAKTSSLACTYVHAHVSLEKYKFGLAPA